MTSVLPTRPMPMSGPLVWNGATWFVFEGGSSEGARFVDEYDTARRGGAPGYR